MASTRQTLDALLKEFYLPGVRNTLNNAVFLLSQVEANSERVEGREVVMALRVGRNQGIGARQEKGTLPTAGQSRIVNVRSRLAYNYGRIEVTGPLMRSITSDRGGFARPLETETNGVTTDLKNDVNRQLYGDGSGTLVLATGTVTTGKVPATLNSTQRRQIVKGMVVDNLDAAGTTVLSSGHTVTLVEATGVTMSGTPVSANGGRVVRSGVAPGDEINGLDLIVDDTAPLYGIDPANESQWASYVAGSAGAASEDMFYAAWQEAHIRSGEEINLWITTPGIHRTVAADLMSLKRFPNTNQIRGGYEGLDVSAAGQGRHSGTSVTLVYDKDAPVGKAFGLCTSRLEFQRASDWEFMEEDGAVLCRVPNQDSYEATLFLYAQLVTDNRVAHAKIEGITDT